MALKTVLRNLIGKWGPMTVDMQTAYNADEEVADTSPIDEETKDVTPQEPATDVTQLIGGETNDNSNQKPANKPASKASGKQTTAVQEIQQEDFPF